MRDISKVIPTIIEAIPKPNEHKALIRKMTNLMYKSTYTAPEWQSQLWAELGVMLHSELGDADTPWKETIREILFGQK